MSHTSPSAFPDLGQEKGLTKRQFVAAQILASMAQTELLQLSMKAFRKFLDGPPSDNMTDVTALRDEVTRTIAFSVFLADQLLITEAEFNTTKSKITAAMEGKKTP